MNLKKLICPVVAIGALVVWNAPLAGATKPKHEHKVTLCHRTGSYSNPYVQITVDAASVLRKHGHDDHEGPAFYHVIPKHLRWGDIIPAFNFGPGEFFGGQNLANPLGRSILNRGCRVF